MSLHEIFEKFNNLDGLGKSLSIFRQRAEFVQVISEIDSKKKELNRIHNIHGRDLSHIRGKLIAHRDGTGLFQTEKMEKVDIGKIHGISSDVFKKLMELANLLLQIENLAASGHDRPSS